jgi:hypothetical protein
MSLGDFVFHYNEYTNQWQCASRDNYRELFSGGNNVLSSSRFEVLVEIINRTRGDLSKANELINER